MKKLTVPLLSLFLLAAPVLLSAQTRMVRLTRYEGDPISALSVGSAFNVTLVRSDRTKAVVEVSEELEQFLKVSLSDGKLSVGLDTDDRNGWRTISRLKKPIQNLTVYLPSFTSLNVSGSAELSASDPFTINSPMTVRATGASEIAGLVVEAPEIVLNCSGSSELDLTARARRIVGKTTGASDADIVLECGSVRFEVSGSSRASLSGSAGEAELSSTGASFLRAAGLAAVKVKVSASGASHASVDALTELEAKASGASDIRYKKRPARFKMESSGASSVKESK